MPRRPWPDTVSIGELSEFLGISTRALRDYAARGVLVPAAQRGRYLTLPSLHGYFDRLRRSADDESASGRASLATVRAEGEAVLREIVSIKLAKLRGAVLNRAEIAASWENLASVLRASVGSIPGKARAALPHFTPHDAETLRQICDDVLAHAAEDAEGVVGIEAPELLLTPAARAA